MVSNLVILFVAVFSVTARHTQSAGFSGLVLSYALSLNQTLNWLVRMTAELESEIVCVERINEYSKLEQEASVRPPYSLTGNPLCGGTLCNAVMAGLLSVAQA